MGRFRGVLKCKHTMPGFEVVSQLVLVFFATTWGDNKGLISPFSVNFVHNSFLIMT